MVGDMSAVRARAEGEEWVQGISTLIGVVVLNLALFEFDLNDIADTLYHRLGGDRIEPRLPSTFPTCLAFVAKVAKRQAGLPCRAEMLALVDGAVRLSSVRYDIVHGYVADYDEARHCLIRFARMKTDRDAAAMHEITLRRITREDLAAAGADAARLAGRAAALSAKLQESARSPPAMTLRPAKAAARSTPAPKE
jgi:hypothetical protein